MFQKLWATVGWQAETERRQERIAAREAGDSLDAIANNIHGQKVRRRDLIQKRDAAKAEAQALRQQGGPQGAKLAEPHVKRFQQANAQIAQIDAVILNLETQRDTMASLASTVEVVGTMRQGQDSMNTMLKQVKVTDVEGMYDDLDESIGQAQDITSAIARPLGASSTADPAEVDDVFAAWDEAEATQQMTQVGLNGPQSQAPNWLTSNGGGGGGGGSSGGSGDALLQQAPDDATEGKHLKNPGKAHVVQEEPLL
jgi:hypothetical protein